MRIYGHHPKYVKPASDLIKIMRTDKKNVNGNIRFALLDSVGHACFDVPVLPDVIEESFVFYKEKI